MEKIVLVDGHSILNRAFYGLPELTNSEGIHTNAVLGFLNILFRILDEEHPDYLAVAFDVHAPTFRHKLYAEYKGTRKPMPEELREQVPLIKEMLAKMRVLTVEQEGLEADDILGTLSVLAERSGREASVISGDRDLLQLATEKVQIRIPKTKRGGTEIENYHSADVMERYGVTPLEFIDMKALMGDTADNIPGVPGIGEKTAAALIQKYHTIENAHDNAEEIRPNKAKENLVTYWDQAVLSKTLATIETGAELPFSWEDARMGNLFTEEALLFCRKLELKSLMKRFKASALTAPEETVEEDFWLVEDPEGAEEVFSKLSGKERVGFAFVHEGEKLLGLSLAWDEEAVFLSVNEKLNEDYLIGKIKRGITLNLKSQLPWIPDRVPEPFFDAGLAWYLLNPLKNDYTYEDMAHVFLNRFVPGKADLLGKKSPEKAQTEDPDAFLRYACLMAQIPLLSYDALETGLKEKNMERLFLEMEMPLLFVLFDMEQAGIRMEPAILKKYSGDLSIEINALEKRIHEAAGMEFNIQSPKQLGEVLFEKMGLPGSKKTKSGYSTAADVLEKLSADYPVVNDILTYRTLTKLKSTYADALTACVAKDGRIHSTFHQTITATGRLSSADPNLQNIPVRLPIGRQIRKAFLPAEGCIFVDADYSQIELRVLAHLSGDENLIRAYQSAEDIHALTASEVFHVPIDEVTPLQRRNAKAVNFGIVYGISSFGLSEDLSISRKEAKQYIDRYFEVYPKMHAYLQQLVADAKEKGYVTTLFGRIRPVPELSSSNFLQRSFGERVAMNSPVQGTAADIIKIAMIRVHSRLIKEGFKSRLILQVHDELLIEAELSEKDRVCALLREEMMGAADLLVPLEIGLSEGGSWYEAK